MPKALNEPTGWDTGMRRLYNVLAQDFAYPNAQDNLVFLDNHDMTRFFLSIGRDINKLKMGLAFLLTTRGIPEIYYGTELLMDGDGGYHPNVRKDFPGGWSGDRVNAFTPAGRTSDQNAVYDYLKKLLMWRKNQPLIHNGKLTHYIPADNIYVYFRHDEGKAVMVVLNANATAKELDTKRFEGNLKSYTSAKEIFSASEHSHILSGNTHTDNSKLSLRPWEALILELK
jgi:glycosidase